MPKSPVTLTRFMAVLTRRNFLALAGGAAACGVGGGVYCFGIEPVWLRTIEIDLRLRGLPAGFDGYTLAQLSDFHVGSGVPRWLVEDAVERANASSPDLVCLTGDFVHRGRNDQAREVAAPLGDLVARDGVLAVLGNHDAGVYRPGPEVGRARTKAVADQLEAKEVSVLHNERTTVERGGSRLDVTGFGDPWSGHFEARPAADGVVSVALCHNPDAAPELGALGYDAILSGHTHGGQVSIPFLGPPILPVRIRTRYAGLYDDLDGPLLYVNRGVGWLRRVRLFVRPEVTILRLKRA